MENIKLLLTFDDGHKQLRFIAFDCTDWDLEMIIESLITEQPTIQSIVMVL